MISGALPWPAIDAAKAIPWVESKAGITLAASQREAVQLALTTKVLVITGGPGVGKTTLVNSILKILSVKGVRIALAAPTGRAAKRLSESTGLEAKTIHRLLEVDPMHGGFRRNEEHALDCDLLVVDETSMIDVPLMHALLKAVPDHAALILVGDVDQLPSVGPGQVLADIIASGAVPVVRLTEVFRQAAESRIIVNAHRINQGLMPEWAQDPASDFHFIECADAEDGVAKILQIVRERIPARYGLDPIRDIQVLCPMNRGGLGARSLNIDLQQALNPPGELRVERFGSTYGIGDKVMQVENDYDKRGLQRRPRRRPEHRSRGVGDGHRVRRAAGDVRLRRTRRGGARLRHDHPQEPGLGIPGRRHPADHPALSDAAAEPALHRRHPRQAARRHRRAEEGDGDRGEGEADPAAVVEAEGVADAPEQPQKGLTGDVRAEARRLGGSMTDKSSRRTALLAGASGLVGGHLLQRLLADPRYKRVITVSRKALGIEHPKLRSLITDFDHDRGGHGGSGRYRR